MPYKDPDQQRAAVRAHYVRNKDQWRDRSRSAKGREWKRKSDRLRYERILVWYNELKTAPCTDCGHSFPPAAMDFHHVRGTKEGVVSSMVARRLSKTRILAEIEKCDLLCAVCHRLRHVVYPT